MNLHSKSSKKFLIFALVVCYLSLLGLHHFRNSEDFDESELLEAEAIRQEFPAELSNLVSKSQASSMKKPSKPKSQDFGFQAGTQPRLAPLTLSEKDKYRFYVHQAAKLGCDGEGLTVLGFRGLSPSGRRHPSGDNASNYDDTFVVLDPINETATELLGSTHAGQFTSTLSPGGVAQIKPGLYRAQPCGEYAQMPSWLVTTPSGRETVPCWRDADGNGFIDADEESASDLQATEILFHNGRYQDYGSSIGCQVLPPQLMKRFIAEIGVSNSFDYLLIDANKRF